MRAHPDQWTRIRTYPAAYSAVGVARGIRLGLIAAYGPTGTFDARTELVDDGTALYARFNSEYTRMWREAVQALSA